MDVKNRDVLAYSATIANADWDVTRLTIQVSVPNTFMLIPLTSPPLHSSPLSYVTLPYHLFVSLFPMHLLHYSFLHMKCEKLLTWMKANIKQQ